MKILYFLALTLIISFPTLVKELTCAEEKHVSKNFNDQFSKLRKSENIYLKKT
jgi:hypothetical protein